LLKTDTLTRAFTKITHFVVEHGEPHPVHHALAKGAPHHNKQNTFLEKLMLKENGRESSLQQNHRTRYNASPGRCGSFACKLCG
jgi:hypothetical protein